MGLLHVRVRLPRAVSIIDVFLILGLTIFIYLLVGVAQDWAGPFHPKAEIRLDLWSLIQYSFFSLIRVLISYFLSLVFTLGYGYAAAKSRVAEPLLIALLDILQSVPVLGFMPGLVLALVSLFPNSNIGLEIATIVMIFTGQAWNMVFSFYSSIKTVPSDLRDLGAVFRLRKFDVLRKIEIPLSVNGLLWNSMLSMAGGWFFLMVIESFRLGDRDYRLPGVGSYMSVAYETGNYRAAAYGILVMFFLIFVVDRCIWAPLVVWSERYKFDGQSAAENSRSVVLEWIRKSEFVGSYDRFVKAVSANLLQFWDRGFPRKMAVPVLKIAPIWHVLRLFFMVLGIFAAIYGVLRMYELVSATSWSKWWGLFVDTMITMARVATAVVVGSLWTVPVGVFIGTNPKWTRRLQPVVQIVASFPAPMLYPLITVALIRMGIGLHFGSVVLMLLAAQWYILFNVISGARLIPRQMLEVAKLFRISGLNYWKSVILPAIFPSLLNGWITAAGGAWNACIVAEFVHVGDTPVLARGVGSAISVAANAGDYPGLAAGILTLVTTVVLLNRFLWGSLYRLAETRFRLEAG